MDFFSKMCVSPLVLGNLLYCIKTFFRHVTFLIFVYYISRKVSILQQNSRSMKEDQIVIYKDENNAIQLDVRMAGEMIWLTRQQLATLFGRDYKTISKHINNALKEELADEVVVAKFANTTKHGAMEGKTQTREKEYFNLDFTHIWTKTEYST